MPPLYSRQFRYVRFVRLEQRAGQFRVNDWLLCWSTRQSDWSIQYCDWLSGIACDWLVVVEANGSRDRHVHGGGNVQTGRQWGRLGGRRGRILGQRGVRWQGWRWWQWYILKMKKKQRLIIAKLEEIGRIYSGSNLSHCCAAILIPPNFRCLSRHFNKPRFSSFTDVISPI